MADLQQEHHREIEGLLENIRQLSRELRLQMLIIDNFIPQEYQVSVFFLLTLAAVQTKLFAYLPTPITRHNQNIKDAVKTISTRMKTDFMFW